ncbi:MFS transporter [Streptomyces sp. NPDC058683]|uniref:MFS transporter n=1 Tax=Streptomyces sp. NPDC058683 TaxID=3346597 RepID=UPI00365CEB8F
MRVTQNPDFRRLRAAQGVSQIGSQIGFLALPLAALQVLHASVFEVSVLTAVGIVPFLLIGLPAGVWIDRMPRRPVLIATDLFRALLLFTVPLAYALDMLTLGQLYVVAFGQGVANVFFDVAYQSYLPDVVETDQLTEGNAQLELARSASQVIGPSAGGWLISALKAPVALGADALSFLFSAFMVSRIPPGREKPVATDGNRTTWSVLWKEVGEGLRFVRRHRLLAPVAGVGALLNFSFGMVAAIFTTYAVRELGFSAAKLGTVMAIGSLGIVLGAAVARRLSQRLGTGPSIVLGALLNGVGPLLTPAAPASAPEVFITCGVFVQSFGVVLFNVNQVSLRQSVTPRPLMGRMTATIRFVVWGTLPVGSLCSGALATSFGLHRALWVSAAVGALAFLGALFSDVRTVGTKRVPLPTSTSGTAAAGVPHLPDAPDVPGAPVKADLDDSTDVGSAGGPAERCDRTDVR